MASGNETIAVLRALLKILGILFLLVGLLIAVAIFLPDRQYRNLTESVLGRLTGNEVIIGDLVIDRGRKLSVDVKDFSIANPAWAKQADMLKANRLYVSISVPALLTGRLSVYELLVDGLNLDLEKEGQGRTNWAFITPDDMSESKPQEISLEKLSRLGVVKMDVTNSRIDYSDETSARQFSFTLDDMHISESTDGLNQLIEAKGAFNKMKVSIEGKTPLINALGLDNKIPFDVTASIDKTQFQASGEVESKNHELLLSSNITAHSDNLADLSEFTTQGLPSLGPVDLSAELHGNLSELARQGIDLSNLDLKIDDPDIKFTAQGSLSGLMATNQGDITLNLDVANTNKLLELAHVDKDLPGTLTVDASVTGDGGDYDLIIQQAGLNSDFLQIQLTGSVTDLLNGASADIDLNAKAPDLGLVTHWFGQAVPDQWGPINAQAKLTGKDSQYALENINLDMDGKSKVSATGTINSLIGFNNMDLDVEATLDSLSEISAFTPITLPDVGPMHGTGEIHWLNGKLSLVNAAATYDGFYGKADASGNIGDLIHFDKVDLKANASIPNLGIAEAFSGHKMPKIGTVTASADLVSPEALDLSAINLVANYDNQGIKASAKGSIDSMIKKLAELDLSIEASVSSLSDFSQIIEYELPDIGPLTAQGKVTGATNGIQFENVEILSKDEVLKGGIKEVAVKPFEFKGAKFNANVSTSSLEQLMSRFKHQGWVDMPASLSGEIEYNEGNVYIKSAELDVIGNTVIGDLSILNFMNDSERRKLAGELNLLDVDVDSLENHESQSTLPPDSVITGKVLPQTSLHYDFIRETDLDLNFKFGRVKAKVFDIENSSVNLHSKNGVLTMGPFTGNLAGGKAQILIDIVAKQTPALTTVTFRLDDFDVDEIGDLRGSDWIRGSDTAFFRLALHGQGETIAEILGDANGGGAVYFENMLVKAGALDIISSAIFKQILDAINPLKKKKQDTMVKCAAATFQIVDGLLSTPNGMALEADEFSVTGTGRVNFVDEKIKMEFTTKAKRGLGLGFGRLTSLVQVEGTLAKPKTTLNPKGIFEIGASAAAAMSTGGLTLLAQGLYDMAIANSKLCAKAIGDEGVGTGQ